MIFYLQTETGNAVVQRNNVFFTAKTLQDNSCYTVKIAGVQNSLCIQLVIIVLTTRGF